MDETRRLGARMHISLLVMSTCLVFVACSNNERRSVTGPDGPSAESGVRGVVLSDPTGQPIPGAIIEPVEPAGLAPITAGPDGSFVVPNGLQVRANVRAPGHQARTNTMLQFGTPNTISLLSDAILPMFREMVRDGRDLFLGLQPVVLHASPISVYIKTTLENGQKIPESDLAMMEALIRKLVPQGSRFPIAGIERGEENRTNRGPGFLIVKAQLARVSALRGTVEACGAGGIGSVTVQYNGEGCLSSSTYHFSPTTFAHEVVHGLGYFHTSRPGLMGLRFNTDDLGLINMSPDEQMIARVANLRCNGSADIDDDARCGSISGSSVELQP